MKYFICFLLLLSIRHEVTAVNFTIELKHYVNKASVFKESFKEPPSGVSFFMRSPGSITGTRSIEAVIEDYDYAMLFPLDSDLTIKSSKKLAFPRGVSSFYGYMTIVKDDKFDLFFIISDGNGSFRLVDESGFFVLEDDEIFKKYAKALERGFIFPSLRGERE